MVTAQHRERMKCHRIVHLKGLIVRYVNFVSTLKHIIAIVIAEDLVVSFQLEETHVNY